MKKWRNITATSPVGDENEELQALATAISNQTGFSVNKALTMLTELDDVEQGPGKVRAWFEAQPTVKAVLNNDYHNIANYIMNGNATAQERLELLTFCVLVCKFLYKDKVDPPKQPES